MDIRSLRTSARRSTLGGARCNTEQVVAATATAAAAAALSPASLLTNAPLSEL